MLAASTARHATYHRGQVVSLLRQMGYPVPATDLIVYFYERASPSEFLIFS